MKILIFLFAIVSCVCSAFSTSQSKVKQIRLFDGKTFKGWQGDTLRTWRIQDGALVGGSLTKMYRITNLSATTKSYTNYVLKLKFKLTGKEGFINGGVQFHSQRIANPPYEMIGYQADIGEGYWASLYDESRRNKLLVTADPAKLNKYSSPTTGMIMKFAAKAGESGYF